MAHLLQDPKGISVLKAYWVNHAVDQNAELETVKSNKRQACVGVYGVDIHPDGSRFATCGADEKIKIWSMAPIIDVNVEVSECVDKLLCCCKYDKSVNQNTNYSFNNTIHCVKWSHNGHYLGSGAADGIVTLWALQSATSTTNSLLNESNSNIENWIKVQQLTKHRDLANSSNLADVQEIAFSPNDHYLVSAGSDHNIIIYHQITHSNNHKYECIQVIHTAHNDIILGLCFDPLGQFLTSQSADGTAKIWSVSSHKRSEYELHHTIHNEFKKRSHFIRKNRRDDLTRLDVHQRGSWSPDGEHLLCSFGVTKDNIFISPVYHRLNFENEHSFVGHSKPTTVSKWNPRIYQSADAATFFVAAISSMDRKLSMWCSNSKTPLIVFSDIGKEAILDLAWSRTGDVLMACTHDGNVIAFVFGKDAFNGCKLSANQHMQYVQSVCRGSCTPNELKTMQNNIELPQHSVFKKTKAAAAGEEGEVYVPSDEAFAVKEDEETHLNMNFDAQVMFDAVEGKQKRHINDYYEKETHRMMDIDINTSDMSTPTRKESDSAGINELSVRRAKKKAPKSPPKASNKKKKRKKKTASNDDEDASLQSNESNRNRKKKRKRGSNESNGNKKKKRKYNEVFLKMEHPKCIRVTVRFTDDKESGYVVMESKVMSRAAMDDDDEEEETVTLVCAVKHVNGSRRMEWKTEIPGCVTQMVCNEGWTVCGTIDGELYCFNHYGLMAMPPIQLEEEIVCLSYDDAYLMIITADCHLRSWKLSRDMNGFDPIQVVTSNFSNLIRMSNKQMKRKDISLKNAFITSRGSIMLTLSNEYVFTYKVSLNCWLRICDDKYWLSNQRRQAAEEKRAQRDTFTFDELLSSMNDSFKSVSRSNQVRYSEACKMHTISHLEQQLSTLRLFGDQEEAFEKVMIEYVQQLISSLSLNGLQFVVNKMDQILKCLLNSKGGAESNDWPGSVPFQRKLLRSLIQIVNAKNTDSEQQYYVQLQQLTHRYDQALHAATQNNHSF
eukprot:1070816_1